MVGYSLSSGMRYHGYIMPGTWYLSGVLRAFFVLADREVAAAASPFPALPVCYAMVWMEYRTVDVL